MKNLQPKPPKFDKPPAGHEHLGASKHFGGVSKPARPDGPQDGLAAKAKAMKFIGG